MSVEAKLATLFDGGEAISPNELTDLTELSNKVFDFSTSSKPGVVYGNNIAYIPFSAQHQQRIALMKEFIVLIKERIDDLPGQFVHFTGTRGINVPQQRYEYEIAFFVA